LCNARPKPKSWTTAAFAQFQFFDPTGGNLVVERYSAEGRSERFLLSPPRS
jgi:hypothetical protein